jgi:hypothetical protein
MATAITPSLNDSTLSVTMAYRRFLRWTRLFVRTRPAHLFIRSPATLRIFSLHGQSVRQGRSDTEDTGVSASKSVPWRTSVSGAFTGALGEAKWRNAAQDSCPPHDASRQSHRVDDRPAIAYFIDPPIRDTPVHRALVSGMVQGLAFGRQCGNSHKGATFLQIGEVPHCWLFRQTCCSHIEREIQLNINDAMMSTELCQKWRPDEDLSHRFIVR